MFCLPRRKCQTGWIHDRNACLTKEVGGTLGGEPAIVAYSAKQRRRDIGASIRRNRAGVEALQQQADGTVQHVLSMGPVTEMPGGEKVLVANDGGGGTGVEVIHISLHRRAC